MEVGFDGCFKTDDFFFDISAPVVDWITAYWGLLAFELAVGGVENASPVLSVVAGLYPGCGRPGVLPAGNFAVDPEQVGVCGAVPGFDSGLVVVRGD